MKKKIINSLKLGSLLGFASNNIKADYTLRLTFDISGYNNAIFNLEGDNNTILNDPTECTNDFLNVVKNNKCHHEVNNFEDIKKGYVPVYYYVKGQKDPKICSFVIEPGGKPELYFDCGVNNVEEVVWVKKSDKQNNVTFCSNDDIKDTIKSTKFLVDEKYIYNLFLKKGYYKSIDNIKKDYDINITSDKDGNQNIEILCKFIFKIPDSVEFKIFDKDVEGGNFITSLNKLKNLYIATSDIKNVFNNYIIKKEAIIYIVEYDSKKYYIISNEKLTGENISNILQSKEDLKGKDLKFDDTTPLKKNLADNTVAPGIYKLIDKKMPKPTVYKYKFTGDSTAFKFNPEVEEKCASKIRVLNMVNSDEKSNFMENGTTYNTVKYNFVAINEDTNQRFINEQALEPGTYKLIREERPQENKDKTKGQGQGDGQVDPEKNTNKKMCGCY